MNTPAPALNHELSSSVSEGSQRHALIGRSISEPNLQSIGQPHTVPVCQSAAGNSLDEQAKDCHRALAHDSQDSADPKSRTSKVHQQLLAWQSRAYRTARAPLAAIRSQAVPERRSQMQVLYPASENFKLMLKSLDANIRCVTPIHRKIKGLGFLPDPKFQT